MTAERSRGVAELWGAPHTATGLTMRRCTPNAEVASAQDAA